MQMRDAGFTRNSNEQADCGFVPPLNASQDRACKRKLWVWIERAFLIYGVALLAIYGAVRIEGTLRSRAAVKAFDADSTAIVAGPVISEGPTLPEVDFTLWDNHRAQAYKQSFAEQSGVPLGVLRISKIHIELPVFDGTDDLTLNHAIGRIAGTARPGERGNIGIAGHRDGFFRGLKDIAIGDTIELKTPKGIDMYAVEQINVVSPNDVTALGPRSVPSLTLVTCYPFHFIGSAPKRYIVTSSLIRETRSEAGSPTPDLLLQAISSTRRAKCKTSIE
jgi:sortase A